MACEIKDQAEYLAAYEAGEREFNLPSKGVFEIREQGVILNINTGNPLVRAYGNSNPLLRAYGNSNPMVWAYDNSNPMVWTNGNSSRWCGKQGLFRKMTVRSKPMTERDIRGGSYDPKNACLLTEIGGAALFIISLLVGSFAMVW